MLCLMHRTFGHSAFGGSAQLHVKACKCREWPGIRSRASQRDASANTPKWNAKLDPHWNATHDTSHKCAQVGDYAADKRVLQDLQHEAAVYEHLRAEQGVSVPRFVACGYIMDSTLYFIATELLGPSLDSAAAVEKTLELTALHALDRVHSCGVLHR